MNDEGRDLLVQAALTGHKQRRFMLHGGVILNGECAVGILHLAMHASREEALLCASCHSSEHGAIVSLLPQSPCLESLYVKFQTNGKELDTIIKMNDSEGRDFLSIARKLGAE